MSDAQWDVLLAGFEGSVASLASDLDKIQAGREGLRSDIQKLEGKIAALREKAGSGSNVIDEIRLKGLLNDLKDKLVQNSNLEHRWDDQQKDFEQKALSLVALYNSRIGKEVEEASAAPGSLSQDPHLATLTLLAQKRAKIQLLLKTYPSQDQAAKFPTLSSVGSLRTDDRESLQLTLDLLRDRKKDLSDQVEKYSLEEEEARNELKLQVKMQEFLEDLRRQNEDSGFSGGNLKRNDLERALGQNQKTGLDKKIADLRQKTLQDRKSLDQIDQWMEKIQAQMSELKGGKIR